MDLITYIVVIAFDLILVGLAVVFRAFIFSTIAGIVTMSGLAYLISQGSLVLHTAESNGSFITSVASAGDYQVYVSILVIFTVVPFLLTLGIARRNSET